MGTGVMTGAGVPALTGQIAEAGPGLGLRADEGLAECRVTGLALQRDGRSSVMQKQFWLNRSDRV